MAIFDNLINTLKKPAVLSTIGAAAGGALGGGTGTSTVKPIEPAGYSTLGDLLRTRATQRLMTPFDTKGYEATGIQNVNDAFGGADMALQNKLTASGLASSPVAGAANAKFEATRAGSIADFLNTVPEVQRQADNQDFGMASDFYNSRTLGQEQTFDQPGGGWGGAAGGVLEMLGQLHGEGKLGGVSDQVLKTLGLGGGAAAGLGGIASGVIPGVTGTAAQGVVGSSILSAANATAPTTALAGPAASTVPGAGGGLSAAALLPLLPVAAAAIPAYFAIKNAQVHPTADLWVQESQNPFDQLMRTTQDPAQRAELAKGYLAKLQVFMSKGEKERIVGTQALQTFTERYGDPKNYGVNISAPAATGLAGFITNLRAKGRA